MPVIKSEASPNIYKINKFVIVGYVPGAGSENSDPKEAGANQKRPIILQGRRIFRNSNKVEMVDTEAPIVNIAVPENLRFSGAGSGEIQFNTEVAPPNSAAIGTSTKNALICPPYRVANPDHQKSFLAQLADGTIPPQAVIYAMRLEADVRTGISQPNSETKLTCIYVDTNVDGRMLKISSQSKSNKIDLSVKYGLADQIKACQINEDAAIEYLSDIDEISGFPTVLTSAPDDVTTEQKYAIAFNGTDSSINTKVALVPFSPGSGSGVNHFRALSDVNSAAADLISDQTPDDGDAAVTVAFQSGLTNSHGGLIFSAPNFTGGGSAKIRANYIINKNFQGGEGANNNFSYFAVCPQPPLGDREDNESATASVGLHTFSELIDNGIFKVLAGDTNGEDSFSALDHVGADNPNSVYVLTASPGEITPADDENPILGEVRFRQLGYLEQLGGVTVADAVKSHTDIESDDGVLCLAKLKQRTTDAASNARHTVTFDTLGSILSDPDPAALKTGTDVQAGSWLVVKKGGTGGTLQTALLHADLFGGGGGGNVSYESPSEGLTTGRLKLGTQDLADSQKYQVYTPTLFGICKENGSYEYRYFLTSLPVTST